MTLFAKLDYAGICLMIAGSATPAIYYAFSCHELESWRYFYLGLMYGMCGITLVLMMIPYMDRPGMNGARSLLYILTACSAVIPIGHIIIFVE